jgi:hypothetical protein
MGSVVCRQGNDSVFGLRNGKVYHGFIFLLVRGVEWVNSSPPHHIQANNHYKEFGNFELMIICTIS